MLIRRSLDRFEKLTVLGGMASDDILARPQDAGPAPRYRRTIPRDRRSPLPGVYRTPMPNGRYINLLRVMFTDFCMMDCAYCPNSHWVPRRRHAFKVEELARTFMDLYQRGAVAGLFLTSGIAGTPSKTMERLLKVVELLRERYRFRGYIHLKVMPGADYQYVEAAYRLGTRLSVNLEAPTAWHMERLSARKDLERHILATMEWIHRLQAQGRPGAVGQVTQLVVGAADEADADIIRRVDSLYSRLGLKRVYYSAFRPVRYTPLEEHPVTPLAREHRLYQVDWLRRVYGFSMDEVALALDPAGFLPLEHDPKTTIALRRLEGFPVDVNTADEERLLRVPGIGPVAARRIVRQRRFHTIDTWRDLQAMGVVRRRAWPFLVFPGHRPPRARQLRMELWPADHGRPVGPPGGGRPACAGDACAACPLYGTPGHPGPS